MKYEIYTIDNCADSAQYVTKEIFEMIERIEEESKRLEERLEEAEKNLGNLIGHFHRYGMQEESLVILMEVEKASKYFEKYKDNDENG